MGPLDLATAWASVETLHILESLSCHLPMALLHMGGLLFRNGAEDGVPEVGKQRRNGDRDGQREGLEKAERTKLRHCAWQGRQKLCGHRHSKRSSARIKSRS